MTHKNAAGEYIKTGEAKASKGSGKRIALEMAGKLGTGTLIWLLIRRHKVCLLAIGNVILVLNWAIPMWPQFVLSLF